MPAGAIAERMGIAPSSLTFHLQQLLHAGLASQRRQGRQVIYAMIPESVNELAAYLTENCCGRGGACQPACEPPATARPRGAKTAA
jgi:DNA-binding transcriptional ArsR family regulator